MSDDDHINTERKTPPEEHEWPQIWRALDRADMAWMIVKPFHAVVTNWKALVIVVGVLLWINKPEIAEALRVIAGLSGVAK